MSNNNAIKNADQTELEALLNSIAPTDAGITDEIHASAYALDTIDVQSSKNSSEWHERDMLLDDVSSALTTELTCRTKLLQKAYPFVIQSAGLKINENPNLFYLFCLVIATYEHASNNSAFLQATVLFEKITLDIVTSSLGKYAKSFPFGYPRANGASLQETISILQNELQSNSEWHLCSEPTAPAISQQKDLGIDQIIWVKRPDNRNFGHLFILGQCACGGNYPQKTKDIDIEGRLSQYFHPLTHVKAVKSMSIPFILAHENFCQLSKAAGWLFDRISLSALYIEAEDISRKYTHEMLDAMVLCNPQFSQSTLYQQYHAKK